MKENKDEALTYEELSALCKKQEEYIIDDLNYRLSVVIAENDALRWSLTTAHKEMNDWKKRSDMWEEYYYNEHKRAEKLFDKLEALKNE